MHHVYLWQMAVECSERAILCGEQGASTEALLNHHAAYHWAGAAEALEAGKVWDSGVLECAAKALRAAIDSNRDPAGKFEVMFALHCMIAQGLLQSARDVGDPFVASASCSLAPLPAVSADDVAQYASDIVETTLSGVSCQHQATTSSRADLWELNAALARDLCLAKLREVQELSLRAPPDCTRPSSLAGEIARQELLLKYRIRHALAVEAGDGAEDSGAAGLWLQCIVVLNMPKIDVQRAIVQTCVQAWEHAAEAMECDQTALAHANVVLAKETLKCLNGTCESSNKPADRRSLRSSRYIAFVQRKSAQTRAAMALALAQRNAEAVELWEQVALQQALWEQLVPQVLSAATRKECRLARRLVQECKAAAVALEARAVNAMQAADSPSSGTQVQADSRVI
jgi:hypothetical protein